MRVKIKENYDELSKWAADYVVYRINKHRPSPRKPFVLGLPSGSTPLGMFKYLAQAYKHNLVSFENVIFFSMGEYIGMGAGDEQSLQYILWDKFLKYINVKPEHVYFLNGLTKDFAKECANYEKNIKKYGGVDLFIGGVGVDGHIAFNEPYSSLNSRTRAKMLAPSTKQANSRFFNNDISKVPPLVLTIGISTIMEAQEVMIMASGKQKSQAIQKAIEGNITHAWPISVLQKHLQGIIVCDKEAASALSAETIQYFTDLQKVPQFI
ncbi:MAG: glucosamine-6-phosphate deaminase [Alphaproteobacteria bacterium]|nr:glucosamine-6-phosphate deaminase [Alphaproteobacteria bacterium]